MASCFVNNNKCFCFSCWSGLSVVTAWGEFVFGKSISEECVGVSSGFKYNILSWNLNQQDNRERIQHSWLHFFYSSNPTSFFHSIHSWIYKRRSLYNSPLNSCPPQLNQYQLVPLVSHPFELSAVHLLKSLTKHLKSGQWEYLLSLTVIIQTPQAVFSFFFTCWCYSRGIQSASPNLCIILSLSLIHLFSNAFPKKDRRGEGWIWIWGRVTKGYIQPPFLNKMCGLQVRPSVDATDPVLSSFSFLVLLFGLSGTQTWHTDTQVKTFCLFFCFF